MGLSQCVRRVDQIFVAGDDSSRQRVQPRVAQRAEQQAKHRGGGGRLGRLRQIWWTAAGSGGYHGMAVWPDPGRLDVARWTLML
eukprot:scaffold51277_cov25-Phaeocystis_antarctica.AAC.1